MKNKQRKIVYYRRRITLFLMITICISLGYSSFHLKKETEKQPVENKMGIQDRWDAATDGTKGNDWNMILVNETHLFANENEMKLVEIDHGEFIDKRILSDYLQLKKEAQKAGYQLAAISGYRSIDYQEGLFATSIENYRLQGYSQKEAEQMTKKYVQIPGASEHHTGLAIDIASEAFKNSGQELTDELENTPEYKWLEKNAAKYGFILRYPKGKEKVTGIGYEPWHFRYVGVKEAEFLKENELTLEEWHEKMQKR